jgi:hypothetical protein
MILEENKKEEDERVFHRSISQNYLEYMDKHSYVHNSKYDFQVGDCGIITTCMPIFYLFTLIVKLLSQSRGFKVKEVKFLVESFYSSSYANKCTYLSLMRSQLPPTIVCLPCRRVRR